MSHLSPTSMKFSAVALLSLGHLLILGLPPATAQINSVVNFDPPPQDAPGNREAGGLRSDTCADTTNATGLMALVPSTNVGLTAEASPDLFAYVPPNNAEWAELRLFNEGTGEEVFVGEVPLPSAIPGSDYSNKAAIVTIPLASGPVSLQPGENYLWALMLVCNGENRAEDIVVQAVVQHIGEDYISTLPEDVSQQLDRISSVSADEKLVIYSSAGLWQNLLSELSPLMQTSPDVYQPIWTGLLTNQGMGAIADAPSYTSDLAPLSAH